MAILLPPPTDAPPPVLLEQPAIAEAEVALCGDDDLQRFALTFYGALADSDAEHPPRLSRTSRSGSYVDYVTAVLVPGPSPPFFLQADVPATLAQPFPSDVPFNPGFAGGTGPAVTTGLPAPRSESWSSRYGAILHYAPGGAGDDGWRFSAEIASERVTLKSQLGAPIAGNALSRSGPSVATGCFFFGLPGVCTIFERTTPATISTLRAAAADPGFVAIASDAVRGVSERTGVSGTVGWARGMNSPLGEVTVTPLARLGVDRWTYEETETLVGTRGGGAAAVVASRRSGDGRGYRAGVGLSVQGKFSAGLPLRWGVEGEVGGQFIDIDFAGVTADSDTFDKVESYASLGARLELGLSGGWSPYVAVRQRRDVFVSSSYMGSGDVRFTDGANLQLKGSNSSEIETGVTFRF